MKRAQRGMGTGGWGSLGRMNGSTGKRHRPAEMLAGLKGIWNELCEEGSDLNPLKPYDSSSEWSGFITLAWLLIDSQNLEGPFAVGQWGRQGAQMGCGGVGSVGDAACLPGPPAPGQGAPFPSCQQCTPPSCSLGNGLGWGAVREENEVPYKL